MIISHDCCISATEEMFPVVSNYLVSLVQNVPGSSPNDRKQKKKHLLFALKIVACWLTERSSRFQRVCCCFQAAAAAAVWKQPGSSLEAGQPHSSVLGDHAGPALALSACLFTASFSGITSEPLMEPKATFPSCWRPRREIGATSGEQGRTSVFWWFRSDSWKCNISQQLQRWTLEDFWLLAWTAEGMRRQQSWAVNCISNLRRSVLKCKCTAVNSSSKTNNPPQSVMCQNG